MIGRDAASALLEPDLLDGLIFNVLRVACFVSQRVPSRYTFRSTSSDLNPPESSI